MQSLQVNDFACDECRVVKNFSEDSYVTVDEAVATTREEVSSLSQLIHERVDSISNTRGKLDSLLSHVIQEKVWGGRGGEGNGKGGRVFVHC